MFVSCSNLPGCGPVGVIDPTPCAAKKKLGSCELVDPTETFVGGHLFKIQEK